MPPNLHVSAGLDLHKSFIHACILTNTDETLSSRFERTFPGLLCLRDWLLSHQVEVVVCESTSDYWVQIYDLISPHIPVIVENACGMKALPHKKTDKLYAKHIAHLALTQLVSPSRIFPADTGSFAQPSGCVMNW